MDKYSLPQCNLLFSSSMEKAAPFEAVLPDYCRGIKRILRASAVAGMPSTTLYGGSLFCRFPIIVRLAYINEDGTVKSESFTHVLEWEPEFPSAKLASDKCHTFAKVNISRVSAKAKSTRSIEITPEVSLEVSVFCFDKLPLYTPSPSGETETVCESHICTERYILPLHTDTLTDTVTLEEALPAAGELVDCSVCLYITEKEALEGKLRYSANAIFKCSYRAFADDEESSEQYIFLKKEIPTEGEIPWEELTPDSKTVLDIAVISENVDISSDPYGENRILRIEVGYCIHAEIFNQKEIELTQDGFCPCFECEFEKSSYCIEKLTALLENEEECTQSISLDGKKLASVTDAEIKIASYATELQGTKVNLVARATAFISGSDEEGEPVYLDHQFVIRREIDEKQPQEDKKYTLCCCSIAKDAVIKDGELILSYTLITDGAVLEKQSVTAISGAEVFYDRPKPICRSEYIIYYPDKSETLWDIAKKYEIPQKKLADANGIDLPYELCKRTLLIPCLT